jgi:hypothetical protein
MGFYFQVMYPEGGITIPSLLYYPLELEVEGAYLLLLEVEAFLGVVAFLHPLEVVAFLDRIQLGMVPSLILIMQ